MPNNWKTYKFEELYLEPSRNGVSKPKSVRGIGFKMVNMGEIFKYSFISNQVMDRVQLTDAEYNKSMLAEGDLLFARQSLVASGVGKCILVNELNEETTFESHLIRVRLKNAIAYPKFIYYKFQSQNIRNIVISLSNGVAAHGIKGSDLQNIELELPPLPEQKSIASILSTIDDKIENNLAINKTLEEMAMALYKHWFVDFGPFQDGEFVESELGRIPKGWKTGYLKDILKFKKNNIQPSDATKIMPYVPIDCIKSKKLLLDEFKSGEEAKSSLIKFDKGDIIFGAMRVYFHKVCIAPFEGTSRSTAFVFNTHNDFQYSYGLCLLNDENTISFAASNSQGSTIPYAKWDKVLSDMKIIIPPDIELTNFHEIINEYFNKIIEIFHENQTLNQLRDSLLPKLIIGEVRLKEFREESITN